MWITQHSRTIIDLFFTTRPELYCPTAILVGFSDHCAIFEIRKLHRIKLLPPQTVKARNYKHYDPEIFRADLNHVAISRVSQCPNFVPPGLLKTLCSKRYQLIFCVKNWQSSSWLKQWGLMVSQWDFWKMQHQLWLNQSWIWLTLLFQPEWFHPSGRMQGWHLILNQEQGTMRIIISWSQSFP